MFRILEIDYFERDTCTVSISKQHYIEMQRENEKLFLFLFHTFKIITSLWNEIVSINKQIKLFKTKIIFFIDLFNINKIVAACLFTL